MYYVLEIRDPHRNKVVLRRRGESFVENFIKMLYGTLYLAPTSQITQLVDQGGVARNFPNLYTQNNAYTATKPWATNVYDLVGILVGTGATPVSPTDYRIESKIANGSGAGQLSYSDMFYSYNGIVTVNNVNYFELELYRTFTNQSGSDINVSETAIYIAHHDASNVIYYFMIARDVFTPVTFPANQSRTVSYKIRVKTP